MKKRNPLVVLILSLITFGVYYLYWLASTRKVLIQKTQRKIPTIWLLLSPFFIELALVIVITTIGISQRNNLTYVSGTAGQTVSNSVGGETIVVGLLYIFSFLVILPITFYWIWKYSKAVEQYTSGETNNILTFILLWILGIIGIAILQDKYNDIESGLVPTGAGANAGQPVSPTTPTQQPPNPPNPVTLAVNQEPKPIAPYPVNEPSTPINANPPEKSNKKATNQP